jgi:hypothetical protein
LQLYFTLYVLHRCQGSKIDNNKNPNQQQLNIFYNNQSRQWFLLPQSIVSKLGTHAVYPFAIIQSFCNITVSVTFDWISFVPTWTTLAADWAAEAATNERRPNP